MNGSINKQHGFLAIFFKRMMGIIFFFALTLVTIWFFTVSTMKNQLEQEVSYAAGITADELAEKQNNYLLKLNNKNPALAKGLARAQLKLFDNINYSKQNRIDQGSAIARNMICGYKEITSLCNRARADCPLMLSIPAQGTLVGLESNEIGWYEKRKIEAELVKLQFGMNDRCLGYK